MKTYTHRGISIYRDEFRFRVSAPVAWGDQPNEHLYSFKTLKRAKEFIDGMAAQWGIK
jgi:hypothetical protein